MKVDPGKVIRHARELVKESGYNACMLKAVGNIGEGYSRAVVIYDEACKLLRDCDELAEAFITDSWQVR